MSHYRILAAARRIGVSKSTLQYWFRQRVVEDVGRDARGWRVFSNADIRRLRAFRSRPRVGALIPGAERRKTIRVAVRLPLRYAFREFQGGRPALAGRSMTENVSRGGMMFRAPVAPPGRSLGQFRLSLPSGGPALDLAGVVRWAREEARGREAAVGVAFAPMAPATRHTLTRFVYGPH